KVDRSDAPLREPPFAADGSPVFAVPGTGPVPCDEKTAPESSRSRANCSGVFAGGAAVAALDEFGAKGISTSVRALSGGRSSSGSRGGIGSYRRRRKWGS